ncbi:hypothetical protein PACTADRAFT_86113 [Pachysolen tannophilus NRRL Y-2460]|uniref:CSC1/OSCA1-like 7TM region domain-containing protein n=1 Tax=Pachysolen tannophilus NRRL Y-2460 TaxID=669874 RepID=A0A1E4TT20_PACTA|nr:hypothetical protein PACTADRAFT_86113 [Pachysolen tannophilus NRRL Y-2460]
MSSSTTATGSSVSAFVTTLIFNVPEQRRPEPQSKGAFGWFVQLLNKPQSYIIQQVGVDGYFFLRYLFIFTAISAVGGILVWIVLFPVNATNGNGEQGFDIISYSNVKNKNRFYAHVFLSWYFFGTTIYVIYRELIYYVSFRHTLQSTPLYDSLLSSRTMLLTNLPESYQDESRLRSLFPAAFKIWYCRDAKELQKLVKERTKLAKKYEAALNKVIKKSVKLRAKCIKKNKPTPSPEDELIAYIPEKKLPSHKLKPIIGKKVKTLDYAPTRLGELNKDIKESQEDFDNAEKVGSAFIEFPTQLEAQRAYQAVPFAKDLKFCRRIIDASPDDIVWENMGVSFAVRKSKETLAKTILSLTIIFWSFPVAVVGCISNINYLTTKVPFLKFIENMPSVLMGIITALLPTILLALLMALLPPFIRKMGKIGGCMTLQEVEAWTQNWYFGFQVVQVFLVTTLASAATSSVTQIIDEPSSAMTLLAANLPKASNFYITYILLQGLSVSSGALAQIVPLILAQFLGKILDGTPRKKWTRYYKLATPGWGTIYPIYQLLAVILLCYAIISPIIIAFAGVAFFLIYVAFLYNLAYVMDFSVDARGRNYPRALFQTFVGLYLAEICLIGLFVMAKTWGPVVLEAVFLAGTVVAHIYYKRTFLELCEAVPISAIREMDGSLPAGSYSMKDQGYHEIKETGRSFFVDQTSIGSAESDDQEKERDGEKLNPFNTASENSAGVVLDGRRRTSVGSITNETYNSSLHDPKDFGSTTNLKQNDRSATLSVDETADQGLQTNRDDEEKQLGEKQGLLSSLPTNKAWFYAYFHPRISFSLQELRSILPNVLNTTVKYDEAYLSQNAYVNPAFSDPEPQIWVPRDNLGLSTIQIEKAKENGVFVTDENAAIDEKGKIEYTGPPPDYEEAIKL